MDKPVENPAALEKGAPVDEPVSAPVDKVELPTAMPGELTGGPGYQQPPTARQQAEIGAGDPVTSSDASYPPSYSRTSSTTKKPLIVGTQNPEAAPSVDDLYIERYSKRKRHRR